MRSVRLLQFTDTHLYGDPRGDLHGVNTLAAFEAVLNHAAVRFATRDALLLTGDLVQDDPEGYRHIHALLECSQAPVLCVPGNHDLPAAMTQTLGRNPFQIGGTFQCGAWLIVLLNSWAAGRAGGRLGDAQLAALAATFERNSGQHVLVCLHHHPIPMRSRWLDRVGLDDRSDLAELIARHRNVRGVLWGHVHQSLDVYADGVRYMATPSTCAQFLPGSDRFAVDERPPGYRVLELATDGTIASEVIWLDAQ
jgi:Icc protein